MHRRSLLDEYLLHDTALQCTDLNTAEGLHLPLYADVVVECCSLYRRYDKVRLLYLDRLGAYARKAPYQEPYDDRSSDDVGQSFGGNLLLRIYLRVHGYKGAYWRGSA